jgi:hypothetical protein
MARSKEKMTMKPNRKQAWKRWIAAGAIAPALFAFAACGDGEKAEAARKEIKEAAAATRDYAAEARDKFVASSEDTLAELNVKIDQLSDEAVALSGEAKIAAEKKLAELKEAARGAREELDILKTKAGNAWESLKQSSVDSLVALGKAYDDAKAAFDKSPAADAAAGEPAPEATPEPTPEVPPAPPQ